MPLAAHHCNVLRQVINETSQTYPNESLIKLLLTVTNKRAGRGSRISLLFTPPENLRCGIQDGVGCSRPLLRVLAFTHIPHIRCHRASPVKWQWIAGVALNGEQAPQAMGMTNQLRFACWGKYVPVHSAHKKLAFMRNFCDCFDI